jgi:hypothetical protein
MQKNSGKHDPRLIHPVGEHPENSEWIGHPWHL